MIDRGIHSGLRAEGGLQLIRIPGKTLGRVLRNSYSVLVIPDADRFVFDWSGTRDDPGDAKEFMEAEASARIGERPHWIDRMTDLVRMTEGWAKELDWATRRLEKTIENTWVGTVRVPALSLQRDFRKILLEPLEMSGVGEGFADLYLMPAYDDIARLYYSGGRWNLEPNPAADWDVDKARTPFDKASFGNAIEAMARHAV